MELTKRLSNSQRRAFVLRDLLGFSTREAAQLVGSSEVAVQYTSTPRVAGFGSFFRRSRESNVRTRAVGACAPWPEITERLERPAGAATSHRGRRAALVILSVVLVAGALVWALSALRLGPSHSERALARGAITRIPAGRAPQPIAADDHSVWVVSGTSEAGNVLWRIDPRNDRSVELPQTRGAGWPTVGEGFAWVTCSGHENPCGGPSILKLDPVSGADARDDQGSRLSVLDRSRARQRLGVHGRRSGEDRSCHGSGRFDHSPAHDATRNGGWLRLGSGPEP